MLFRTLLVSALLVACTGDEGPFAADSTDPTRDFEVDPPDVDTDWPMDTDPPVPMDDVPFAGEWVDGWGIEHVVTDVSWSIGDDSFTFLEVDAEQVVIIAENDEDNTYNPGLFSRFDWTVVDGRTWYCQTAYDAESADAAREVAPADDTDPSTGGCGGFPWSPLYEPIPIRGEWYDTFGGYQLIQEWEWVSGDYRFAVTDYSVEDQWIVAQNASTNPFNPDLWSRFEWTEAEGGVYYCQVAFAEETEADALAAGPADETDLDAGCAGFSWTQLLEPLPIRGEYVDGFGGSQTITETTWMSGTARFDISDYSVDERWVVAQNAATNEYNPDLWSRFEWAEAEGTLWFCQVAYNAETEADALAAGPADASDPSTSGCGGFAWSSLTPVEE